MKAGQGSYPNPEGVDRAEIGMAHEHALKLARELMAETEEGGLDALRRRDPFAPIEAVPRPLVEPDAYAPTG